MVLIKKIFVLDTFHEEGVIFTSKYDKATFDIFSPDATGLGLDTRIYSWIFVECLYINLTYFRSRKSDYNSKWNFFCILSAWFFCVSLIFWNRFSVSEVEDFYFSNLCFSFIDGEVIFINYILKKILIHANQTLFHIENTNEIRFQNVICVNQLFWFFRAHTTSYRRW